MEAVMEHVKSAGTKVKDVTVSVVSTILDTSSKGLSFLSSLVKGEKKIEIKVVQK